MTQNTDGKPAPWLLLYLIIPVYFFTMFYRMAPSVMAGGLAADFGVPISELSVMSSMTFVSYGLMQLPSGMLADAIGERRTICLITLVAGLANFWFALSGGLAEASAARFLLGIGCSITVPCSALLARNFSAGGYARANSWFLTMGTVGTVCAGAPLLYLCGLMGWRMLMACCGALSLVFAAACWLLIRDPEGAERESLAVMAAELRTGAARVFSCGRFWPVALWFTFAIAVYFSLGGMWWGPHLIHGCGLTPDEAGTVISASYLVALPSQYLLITLSERLGRRRKVMVISMTVCLGSMLALSLFGQSMGPVLLAVQGGCFTLCCAGIGAVAFVSAKELFPLEISGTAIGALQTLPYLAATPVLQKLFGSVLEWRHAATGDWAVAYSQAGWLNCIVIGLALLMGLCVREKQAGE